MLYTLGYYCIIKYAINQQVNNLSSGKSNQQRHALIFTAYVARNKKLHKAVFKKKYGNEHNDKKFIVSSMYTQHRGSRWYTPDIHVGTIDIYVSAPTPAPRLISQRKTNQCPLRFIHTNSCTFSYNYVSVF